MPLQNLYLPTGQVNFMMHALTNILPGWTGRAALDVQPCCCDDKPLKYAAAVTTNADFSGSFSM